MISDVFRLFPAVGLTDKDTKCSNFDADFKVDFLFRSCERQAVALHEDDNKQSDDEAEAKQDDDD